MSELLFENPLTIGMAGAAFTLIALVTWIKGGFPAAFYSAMGLAVLTALLLFVNVSVKTDREQIERVLYDVAAAVQQNDLAKVLTYIHPSAVEGLQRAKAEMPKYHFTEARITRIKNIEVKPHTNPPTAIAEFFVVVSVSAAGAQGNAPLFVRAYFMKRDDRWLVNNYEHFGAAAGFQGAPLSGGVR